MGDEFGVLMDQKLVQVKTEHRDVEKVASTWSRD